MARIIGVYEGRHRDGVVIVFIFVHLRLLAGVAIGLRCSLARAGQSQDL